MLIDKIIIPEKQKKKCVEEILDSIREKKTKKARDTAAKKNVTFFYDALIKLPFPFQIAEAKAFKELADCESLIKDDKISKEEKKAFRYIIDISGQEPDFDIELSEASDKLEDKINELEDIFTSLDKEQLDIVTEKMGGINMVRIENYLKKRG